MKRRVTCLADLLNSTGWSLAVIPANVSQAEEKKATALKIGAALDGYRFEFPCKERMPENPKKGLTCESRLVTGDPKKTDNFTAEKKFGGERESDTRSRCASAAWSSR